MLRLPGKLTPERFLNKHWQKEPLLLKGATDRLRPSISRNELGWLATLDDVESRLIFVEHDGEKKIYRAETGPFDPEYLQNLPKRNWTLLVHDVEKHLPDLRALFDQVPFIPDWRIDDLMVSFAAPGGGVGPHKDNYDVFLCQGIGVRNWRYSKQHVNCDSAASKELALLEEFKGDADVDLTEGDVLYLPPGVAHWGTAKRACMTYSIGMRAPEASTLSFLLGHGSPEQDLFYKDADLALDEATPGYISARAIERATTMLELSDANPVDIAIALGQFATQIKDWLRPDEISEDDAKKALSYLYNGGTLHVHGMSQIAFGGHSLFVNGKHRLLPSECEAMLAAICAERRQVGLPKTGGSHEAVVVWMLRNGAFEIPENS